jgi:YD repeat-containing protein
VNGNVGGVVDPLGRRRSRVYDVDGLVVREVRGRGNAATTPVAVAAGTITHGYDALGRRSGTTFGDGAPSVGFGYDRVGRRVRMSDAAGTLTYAYDGAGRVTGIYDGDENTLSDGSVTWAYDLNNRVKTTTSTASGTMTWVRDGDGNITVSKRETFSCSRLPNCRRPMWRLGRATHSRSCAWRPSLT